MYASPKRSALVSGLLHAAAIVLVLVATNVKTVPRAHLGIVPIAERDISAYLPLTHSEGGGGGGARDDTPATKGPLPPTRLRVFTPPVVRILNENPRLTMEAAILGPPELTVPAPAYGDPNGILGRLSSGPGDGGGIGDGHQGGVGGGRGPGAGPNGEGGGISGGNPPVRAVVTAPVLLWKNEPEYTEDARKAKLQGTVTLRIEIDAHGQVQNIAMLHTLGLGLDERAVESVRHWRFRPGYSNGKPAATTAVVEVSFRLL
jgi:periplasmic protein TonB